MANEVYCSTGAFVGRVNGRNYHLITEYGGKLECDGFELMLFPQWQQNRQTLIDELSGSGLRFPVLHTDKSIGDMLSSPEQKDEDIFYAWEKNCEAAAAVKADRIVFHPWGIPDSDHYLCSIFRRCGRMLDIAQTYGLTAAAENCICTFGSPLGHLERLAEEYPSIGFTIDTRAAQFHRELEAICKSKLLPRVRHVHISDFHGEYKAWDKMYPVLYPGDGDVDFNTFFAALRSAGYSGGFTLESATMLPDGVNTAQLNIGLRFIRENAAGS